MKFSTAEDVLKRFEEVGVSDTFGTKKEIRELPSLLYYDEIIYYATSGFLDGNTWLIVCTDQRLLFLDKGLIYGIKVKEFKLDKINSVSYSKGIFFGKISIEHGSSQFTIENIMKETVERMSNEIKVAIDNYKNQNNNAGETRSSLNNKSLVEQIKEFKELLDMGVITQEEFDLKKKEILGI